MNFRVASVLCAAVAVSVVAIYKVAIEWLIGSKVGFHALAPATGGENERDTTKREQGKLDSKKFESVMDKFLNVSTNVPEDVQNKLAAIECGNENRKKLAAEITKIANDLFKEERYAEAIKVYRIAFGVKEAKELYYNICSCYHRMNDSSRALFYIDKALKLDRYYAKALPKRAKICEEIGDLRGALDAYVSIKAIENEPNRDTNLMIWRTAYKIGEEEQDTKYRTNRDHNIPLYTFIESSFAIYSRECLEIDLVLNSPDTGLEGDRYVKQAYQYLEDRDYYRMYEAASAAYKCTSISRLSKIRASFLMMQTLKNPFDNENISKWSGFNIYNCIDTCVFLYLMIRSDKTPRSYDNYDVLLQGAINKYPKCPEFYFLRAYHHIGGDVSEFFNDLDCPVTIKGSMSDVMKNLDTALRIDPTYYAAFTCKMKILELIGDIDGMFDLAESSLSCGTIRSIICFMSAINMLSRVSLSRACSLYNRVTDLYWNDVAFLVYSATTALTATNDLQRAEMVLLMAEEAKIKSPELDMVRISIMATSGKLKECLKEIEDLLAIIGLNDKVQVLSYKEVIESRLRMVDIYDNPMLLKMDRYLLGEYSYYKNLDEVLAGGFLPELT